MATTSVASLSDAAWAANAALCCASCVALTYYPLGTATATHLAILDIGTRLDVRPRCSLHRAGVECLACHNNETRAQPIPDNHHVHHVQVAATDLAKSWESLRDFLRWPQPRSPMRAEQRLEHPPPASGSP
jgi:hypothetical protein